MKVAQSCPTLCNPMYSPRNSPGQNTGVGCHSFLQGIFPQRLPYSTLLSRSVVSDSLRHHRLLHARLLCPRGFSRQEYWSGLPCPSPGDLLNPGIEPRSPTLQTDSLPPEPQGKPKNTGVDSLSLLQQMFLTQELNWVLLHCRWILHQLS